MLLRFTAIAFLAASTSAIAAAPIVMHHDPGCGCCEKWAAQMQTAFGRPVRVLDTENRAALQRARGVPVGAASCHTAIVDGLTVEGHVPPADIKRALAERPKGITGLAVPGMPIGSPGMEVLGRPSDRYEVVAFVSRGQRVFARHGD